jgi:uncharacterized protein YxjI
VDLFNSPVLLVEQPKEVFGVESKYTVFNPQGQPVALVGEPNLTGGKKAMRFLFSEYSNNTRHTLHVMRPDGMPMMIIDKPFALMTPKVQITWPNGQPIGAIQCHFGLKPRFTLLDPWERQLGEIRGDFFGWDFTISDWQGVEVARVNKQWEGLAATWFTTADRYAVQIRYQLPDPLRSLVVATAITIDVVLRENKGRR